MDHPTRSVRLLQTGIERLTIVSGTNVYLHMQQTQLVNLKKLYDNDLYEPSFRGKFITDLNQMIGLHDAS